MKFTIVKTVTVEVDATSREEALERFGNKENWIGEYPPDYEVHFHDPETGETREV